MSYLSSIDLSQIAPPSVIDPLDYPTILAAMLADLQSRDPAFTALVESDPAYKILEVAAYREVLIRQRVNEAALAVMLAYAVGTDLDNIGATFNVQRLLIMPADPTTIPPTPAVYESDSDFRNRIQLSFEGYTTAGSVGSYIFWGRSADGDVKDIQAVSPSPGNVAIYVLSRTGNGAAPALLIAKVSAALGAATVRPLTDNVTVQSANIINYSITAQLTMYPGPDPTIVQAAAIKALNAYTQAMQLIGYDVTLAGIYGALYQNGVQNVAITSPTADLVIGDGQASYCTSATVTVSGSTNV